MELTPNVAFNTLEEEYGFYCDWLTFLDSPTGASLVGILDDKKTDKSLDIINTMNKVSDTAEYDSSKAKFLKDKNYLEVYEDLLRCELFNLEDCKQYVANLKARLLAKKPETAS